MEHRLEGGVEGQIRPGEAWPHEIGRGGRANGGGSKEQPQVAHRQLRCGGPPH